MFSSDDGKALGIRPLVINDPQDIPPRPRRSENRIELESQPVRVRGEVLHEVWWRGGQWAVTAFGIERLDGTYVAEASRLTENPGYPWPMHMAEKAWVDIDEFTTAWMVALLLHGKASEMDPIAVREMFGRLRPRRTDDRNSGHG